MGTTFGIGSKQICPSTSQEYMCEIGYSITRLSALDVLVQYSKSIERSAIDKCAELLVDGAFGIEFEVELKWKEAFVELSTSALRVSNQAPTGVQPH